MRVRGTLPKCSLRIYGSQTRPSSPAKFQGQTQIIWDYRCKFLLVLAILYWSKIATVSNMISALLLLRFPLQPNLAVNIFNADYQYFHFSKLVFSTTIPTFTFIFLALFALFSCRYSLEKNLMVLRSKLQPVLINFVETTIKNSLKLIVSDHSQQHRNFPGILETPWRI